MAAILVCATSVLTSCSDTTDNPVTENDRRQLRQVAGREVHQRHLCGEKVRRHRCLQGNPVRGPAARGRTALEGASGLCCR